jgi:hypothetical protein
VLSSSTCVTLGMSTCSSLFLPLPIKLANLSRSHFTYCLSSSLFLPMRESHVSTTTFSLQDGKRYPWELFACSGEKWGAVSEEWTAGMAEWDAGTTVAQIFHRILHSGKACSAVERNNDE